MKQKINSKILTKIGRVLSKHGIGVRNSEFTQISKRDFTFKRCLEVLNADYGFVVCANTTNDNVVVVKIESSTNAFYIFKDGEAVDKEKAEQNYYYDYTVSRVELKNNYDSFFVVNPQDRIETQQADRASARKEDPLLKKHAEVLGRLMVQDLNKKLRPLGISLSKIEFKDYSSAWSNKGQINVQLHYDRLPEGLNRILYGGDIVKCQDGKYHMIANISFSRYRDNAELIMRHDLNAKNSLKEYQEAFDVIIDSNEQAVENLKIAKKAFEIFYKYDFEKFDEAKQILKNIEKTK